MNNNLTTENVHLVELLRQAGLDAEAQVVAARIQTVLTDELHHRMKNMLTVVTAVVRQSLRSAKDLTEAEGAIGARLMAMAKAHDLLLKVDWKKTELGTVIRSAVEQHNSAAERIQVHGDEIEVASSVVVPLSLLINELCTNATKYGALSTENGLVALSWSQDAAAQSLTVRWVESGGPGVLPPATKSLGTKLIEDGIPRQFGGTGHLSFPTSGAIFEMTVPLERLRPVVGAG